jgi:hypothetical protein
MTSFKIDGKQKLWYYPGITVFKGDILEISSIGFIDFAPGGFERDADGADLSGRIETPADNYQGLYGPHPVGWANKNSLVGDVNGWRFQAGSKIKVKMEESGAVSFKPNDNRPEDNGKEWNVTVTRQNQTPPSTGYDHLRSLDLQRAAREEFGSDARLYNNTGQANGWLVDHSGTTSRLNYLLAAQRQHGSDWRSAIIGFGQNDWRALRVVSRQPTVLPVLLLPSDLIQNTNDIAFGKDCVDNNLLYVREWYKHIFKGKTFDLTPTIVLATKPTAAEWDAMCPHPEKLYEAGSFRFEQTYPAPPENVIVVFVPFLGRNPKQGEGAGTNPNLKYLAVSPQCAGTKIAPWAGPGGTWPPGNEASIAWSYAHELGHAFGVVFHPCSQLKPPPPDCSSSIMEHAYPPLGTFISIEQTTILASPKFGRINLEEDMITAPESYVRAEEAVDPFDGG